MTLFAGGHLTHNNLMLLVTRVFCIIKNRVDILEFRMQNNDYLAYRHMLALPSY